MTVLHYAPIEGRTEEITNDIINAPELQSHPEQEFAFHLCTEEIVSNIVNYAYPANAEGEMDVTIEEDKEGIAITFKDRGTAFDPLAKEDPDTTLSIEERPIGGLGIFLVKQMMDDVSYVYENGQNILKIRKNV